MMFHFSIFFRQCDSVVRVVIVGHLVFIGAARPCECERCPCGGGGVRARPNYKFAVERHVKMQMNVAFSIHESRRSAKKDVKKQNEDAFPIK